MGPELTGPERSVLRTYEETRDIRKTAATHLLQQRTVREIVRKHEARPAPEVAKGPAGGYIVRLKCDRCGEGFELVSEVEPKPLARRMAQVWKRFCDPCIAILEREDLVAKQAEDRRKWLNESRLPEELRGFQWTDMIAKGRRESAIEACQEWARGEGLSRGIYLTGETGTGKTRLAATAAWERLSRGPLRWISVARLMADLTKGFDSQEHKAAAKLLTGKGPIVLDDFDKVKPSDHGKTTLFTAIDQRVQANVPMIVTSNRRLGELGGIFGDPVMSRLSGHCTQLVMDGPDMRLELQ